MTAPDITAGAVVASRYGLDLASNGPRQVLLLRDVRIGRPLQQRRGPALEWWIVDRILRAPGWVDRLAAELERQAAARRAALRRAIAEDR